MLKQLQKHLLLEVLDSAERVFRYIDRLRQPNEEVNEHEEGEVVADLSAQVLHARVVLHFDNIGDQKVAVLKFRLLLRE